MDALASDGIGIFMSKEVYHRLNSKYLKEAKELLAKGEYPQASEKLWGAFVEAVKAVAAERNITLGTHRSIAEFVSKIHEEHPEWRLRDVFRHAESLHLNFYEDHLPGDYILESMGVVENAIRKMLEDRG
jgi:HEPN domain-containing protein